MRQIIGVFGGTFNPIHHGHLRLAVDLVQQLSLDQLLLVPCHLPVHRAVPGVSSDVRAGMIDCAIEGEARLALERSEIDRAGGSYTIDTLQELRQRYGSETSLVLILGADAYLGLESWKQWQSLLDYSHIVVAARPGFTLPEAGRLAEFTRQYQGNAEQLVQQAAGCIVLQENRLLEISATEIRQLVAAGQSARYLAPEAVLDFIRAGGLYQS